MAHVAIADLTLTLTPADLLEMIAGLSGRSDITETKPTTENATMENGKANQPEILEAGIVERLTSAERRSQIEVAKQYPRVISTFKKRALEMATADERTAAGCFYSMPRAGSRIEGPSVRLAEIVASSWGNLRAQARVIDVTHSHVVAEGVTWDLETNYAVSIEVRRRITGKNGSRYSDDMITVTGNAAASIAYRNSVFKVIPAVYVNPIYEAARRVAVGDAETLELKRKQWVDHAGKFGVGVDRVCASLGRSEMIDLTLDDLKDLAGRLNAIKEGEISVDEAFAIVVDKENGAPKPNLPEEGRRSFGFSRDKKGAVTVHTPEGDPGPITDAEKAAAVEAAANQKTPAEGIAAIDGDAKGAVDGEVRSKNHGAGIAKSMIATAKTVQELDEFVQGDGRKTIKGAYTSRRNEISAADAKRELGGGDDEPPHDSKTGEVGDDAPPPLTDADIPH